MDQSQISEGALVSASDPAPLARIHQIDQVYVDVRQPAMSLENLKQAAAVGRQNGKGVQVEILRSNGEPFGLKGKMLFSGISVDEGTGDVLVRVLVNNPGHRLLPG
ncbi:efflux transporter periplasmic adaptor subunit, partial [Arthrospira platensis SPKY1]|nr:efflux transporter periplasmic adaptor subunit [Arthrospira platensis SPKY1]